MLLKIFPLVAFCILLIPSIIRFNITNASNNISSPPNNYTYFVIQFDKNQQSAKTVSDKFLSFAVDMARLRNNMKDLPIDDEKFINLVQHLKPAYMRNGGTAADCLYFDEKSTPKKISSTPDIAKSNITNSADDVYGSDISNFTFTGKNFSSLYKFSQMTGTKMLFDLNVLRRNPDGSWNNDNAKKIIHFARAHQMTLDWQLGNEPNSFRHVFNISISAKQLSKDYCELKKILNKSGYEKSILVGPEVNHIDDAKDEGVKYVKVFLQNMNDCVDYITWHQYYLDGRTATVEDFLDPQIFNRLPAEIDVMRTLIKTSGKNISLWISETSSAYGGGAPQLSDRFVAGFLWLDKLGACAKAGVQVVVRQTLLGGYYAMIGSDLQPNPDWWVSVLFKKFVGEKVLNLITPDNNLGRVRLYAHCAATLKNSTLESPPQIVIYGVNLNGRETKIYLDGLKEGAKAFAFFLTSDSLQSRSIFLNGEILKLQSDGNLPHLNAQFIDTSRPIELPAFSVIFISLSNVEFPPC